MRKLFVALIFTSGPLLAETRSFPAKDLKELDIHSNSGDLDVQTASVSEVKITYTKKDPSSFDKYCTLTFNQDRNKIHVNVNKPQNTSGDPCRIHFEILMPEGRDLDVSVGNGNLTAKGSYSEMDANIGNGKLYIQGSIPKLDTKTGNGNVFLDLAEARKLETKVGNGDIKATFGSIVEHADIDLKLGNGRVNLSSQKSPQKAELEIKAGTGDAELSFEDKTSFHLVHNSGFGKVTNEFANTANSAFRIRVKNGTGNLYIKKLSGK